MKFDISEMIKGFYRELLEDEEKRLGLSLIPENYDQLLKNIINQCSGEIDNLTQTIGFINPDGLFEPLTKAYKHASDLSFLLTSTGATDYNTAVFKAVKNLINKGIRTVGYDSGVTTNIRAAVRRNVLASVGNLTNQISEQNFDILDCDGWEISAHSACAADHAPYQGRQYTSEDFELLISKLSRPFGTLNCGHIKYPIKVGKTKAVYSGTQLKTMEKENTKGVSYKGVHYTQYEATQKQREIERKILRQQDKVAALEKIKKEQKSLYLSEKTKLTQLYSLYNDFSNNTGLTAQYSRFKTILNI